MRVFYDCEFWEDGQTIRLASIGMVTETGADSLYYVNGEFPFQEAAEANPWLVGNVYPHLPVSQIHGIWHVDFTDDRVVPRDELRHHVEQFLMYAHRLDAKKAGRPFPALDELDADDLELWAYFAAYDHVALCQLWGRMIDLPPYVPKYTNDLKSESVAYLGKGSRLDLHVPQAEGQHDALADARWNLRAFEYLKELPDVAGEQAAQAAEEAF